ncbi:hypothetical protein KFE98_02030 [bacterium SCSIO 12741]|nr:hypothetical protein KFE98_02030 [bacterium SCSIO 12741]
MALVVAVFSFSGISCQDKKCKDFKTGTFQAADEKISDIKIVRNDSIQIETSEARGFENIYKVIWINDCEYKLVLMSSNESYKTLLSQYDTLNVTITAIEGDAYQYTAFLKGKQFIGDLVQVAE